MPPAVPIRVCQVIASINELIGGPAWSVSGLSEALQQHGIATHLLTLDYSHLGPQVRPSGVEFHSYPASPMTRYFRGVKFKAEAALDDLAARSVDIIHNHGLWMRPNVYARRAAFRHQLPLVTSPRGMLEPWSLHFSRFKKAIAWYLYERHNLNQVDLFEIVPLVEIPDRKSTRLN